MRNESHDRRKYIIVDATIQRDAISILNGSIRNVPVMVEQMTNCAEEILIDASKRASLKVKGEEATEEVIRKVLSTYRTTPRPLMNEKSPAELIFEEKYSQLLLIQENLIF